MRDRSQVVDTLQVGRALAALAVCLYHTNLTLALPKYLGAQVFPWLGSGDSGVYYFFVLSGFVIYLVHEADIGHRGQTAQFLWKRARRIYPPLWGILLLLFPVLWMTPSFEPEAPRSLWGIGSDFLAAPVSHEGILGPEWTLRHEVLFYLVFALLIWRPRVGVVVGAVWLGLSAVSAVLPLGFPFSFVFSGFHLLFAFGVLTCVAYQKRLLVAAPRVTAIAGLALFMLAWSLRYSGALRPGVVTSWIYGIGASLAILGGAGLELQQRLRLPKTLMFLGEASYSIYLVNLPAISVIAKVLSHLRGTVPGSVIFVATAALAVCVGSVFHLLVEKPLVGMLRTRQPLRPAQVS